MLKALQNACNVFHSKHAQQPTPEVQEQCDSDAGSLERGNAMPGKAMQCEAWIMKWNLLGSRLEWLCLHFWDWLSLAGQKDYESWSGAGCQCGEEAE